MNIATLRKHYDKLTPRERLAALLDAGLRGDEEEHEALLHAAPKVTYTVRHHFFLAIAYEDLAYNHMCILLGMGCALFMGQGVLFLMDNEEKKNRFDSTWNLMVDCAGAFKMVDRAWQEFCEGQGIDPEKLLVNIPGSGVLSADVPKEMTAGKSDILPYLRQIVDTLCPDEPDPAKVAGNVDALQEALKRLAGDQAGG